MTKIIGIDLGTSNSAAAVIMGGKRLFFEEDLWPNKQFA